MGPIDFPETSVANYQCTLRNSQKERISYLHRDMSMKSRMDL
jgi:hypothetical protein